jgi:plasmid maintenance system antidote protein VapI
MIVRKEYSKVNETTGYKVINIERKKHGYTQKQVARLMGICKIQLNYLMDGSVPLDLDYAVRLKNAFGYTVDYWIEAFNGNIEKDL